MVHQEPYGSNNKTKKKITKKLPAIFLENLRYLGDGSFDAKYILGVFILCVRTQNLSDKWLTLFLQRSSHPSTSSFLQTKDHISYTEISLCKVFVGLYWNNQSCKDHPVRTYGMSLLGFQKIICTNPRSKVSTYNSLLVRIYVEQSLMQNSNEKE